MKKKLILNKKIYSIAFSPLLFLASSILFSCLFFSGQVYSKELNHHLQSAKNLYQVMLNSSKRKKPAIRSSIREQMELYVADKKVKLKPLALPFKKGHWKVTQGNTTKYSHKKKNQFSWDFELVDGNGKFNAKGLAHRKKPLKNYSYAMPIYAVAAGRAWVKRHNKNGKGKSNLVVIKHKNGMKAIYDHIKPNGFNVKKGDKVKKGDLIAYVGYSGTTYPHIHFSVRSKKLKNRTVPIRFEQYYLIEKNKKVSKKVTKVLNGVPRQSQIISASLDEANNPTIP